MSASVIHVNLLHLRRGVTLRSINIHLPSAFPERRMQTVIEHNDQQQCDDLGAALAVALDEDEASTCSVEASEAARQPREGLQAAMSLTLREDDDMDVRVKSANSMPFVFGVLPDVRSSDSPSSAFSPPILPSHSLARCPTYYLAIHK